MSAYASRLDGHPAVVSSESVVPVTVQVAREDLAEMTGNHAINDEVIARTALGAIAFRVARKSGYRIFEIVDVRPMLGQDEYVAEVEAKARGAK